MGCPDKGGAPGGVPIQAGCRARGLRCAWMCAPPPPRGAWLIGGGGWWCPPPLPLVLTPRFNPLRCGSHEQPPGEAGPGRSGVGLGFGGGGGQHVGVPSERGEPSGSPDPLPHNFFSPPPRDSKSRARLRAAPGARPLLPAQGGGRRLERPPRRGEDGTGHRGPPPCTPPSCASPRGFGKNRDLLAGRGPGAPPPPPRAGQGARTSAAAPGGAEPGAAWLLAWKMPVCRPSPGKNRPFEPGKRLRGSPFTFT